MKYLIFTCILFTGFIIIQGCSDPVKGCTDPDAETFDPSAEENQASDCVYARDKFVGEYDAELSCNGTIGVLINGTTSLSIVESSTGTNYVDITLLTNPILRLEATVSQSTLNIDNEIPNVVIGGSPFDVGAKGDLTLQENEIDLTGVLNVTLTGPDGSTTDNCAVTAMKK